MIYPEKLYKKALDLSIKKFTVLAV